MTAQYCGYHNAGAMQIDSFDRGLVIRSPAKLNLFLEVLGKRADGYHAIDTVMCPVTLFDELQVEGNDSNRIEFSIVPFTDATPTDSNPTDSNRTVAGASTPSALPDNNFSRRSARADTDPAWDIPNDHSNLVVRAFHAIQRELGVTKGCRITLRKRIPAAAGMGGGSSDAASAIVAAMVLWSKWDRQLAMQVASELGSDIPLFLGDEQNGIGLARATGRGERIEILSGRPPLCFVISHPSVGSSTAEVYKLWAPTEHVGARDRMLAACSGKRPHATREIEESLFNALQVPASRLNDWIARQLECFVQLGKSKAMMTGSGSACFALVDNYDEGRELSEQLIRLGLPRSYAARAWYAAPIEQQLDRLTWNRP